MKITTIHNIYKPETRGGAEVVVERLVRGLKNRGEEISVITAGRDRDGHESTVDDIKVTRLGYGNFFSFFDLDSESMLLRFFWHIFDMFNLKQFGQVYSILKSEKPDLVLTHNLMGIGFLARLAIWILGIKNIQTVHDAQLIHPSGLVADMATVFWPTKVYAFIVKVLFGSPEVVIFPSEYIKKNYDRFGFFAESKKVVLGNPVDLSLNNLPAVERFGNSNLLFLGQIEEYKGIFDLINAFKSISGEINLHVVGTGQALTKARELAAADQRIKFWGKLSPEELEKNIWPMVDVLINPSKTSESFGMVVIEAYSHGVPVLASAIGALPELIKEGETGWLFRSGDKLDLKNKIINILGDQEQLVEYRQNCLTAAKKYSLDIYLNKLMEFVKIK